MEGSAWSMETVKEKVVVPALPSARETSLMEMSTITGVGVGVLVCVGVFVGAGVDDGVGEGLGLDVTVGVGVAVGLIDIAGIATPEKL